MLNEWTRHQVVQTVNYKHLATQERIAEGSESRSSSSPLVAHGPLAGPAVGGAEMFMRRRVASAALARPVVPVGPTAGDAASRSAVQLRRRPAAGGASRSMRLGAGHAE